MRHSVLFIHPKPIFKKWLLAVSELDPLKRTPEILYPCEDESVWLIPSVGTFGSSKSLKEYINELKPLLLAQELQRLLKDLSLFQGKIDAVQFDEFFEAQIKTSIAEINVLDAWKPIVARRKDTA